jgi:hypothetical protein
VRSNLINDLDALANMDLQTTTGGKKLPEIKKRIGEDGEPGMI